MNEAGRPRLLVLASTYPRWAGDAEPGFVHELAKRLVDRFEVTVLCPHARGAALREQLDGVEVRRYRYAPAALEVLVNDGGIVTNLRRRKWTFTLVPTFLLVQAWACWRLLRQMRPNVVHAHWLIPQGLTVAFLSCLGLRVPPIVVTSHGADLFALQGRAFRRLKRLVIGKATVTTVVSEAMCCELARAGHRPERIRVEPMGVDMRERFSPDPTAKRSFNEILFVGRFVEKKGLRHLLDAMPSVLAQRADVILTIAGFGPEESERRAQVSSLGIEGSVRFLGPVEQAALPVLYRRAAVLVAPFVRSESGDQDGLGLVVAEAIGCACPVIIGDVAASAEFPVPRVNPRDHVRLAEAILEVMEDPRAARDGAMQARQQVATRYDWTEVSKRYWEVLLQAAKTWR